MYVLDTNAFYYAAGLSECSYDVKKLQLLIKDKEVFISSTSLFEFLIKYRYDLDTIHQGGKYLWEKKIKVMGNEINPIPKEFDLDIMNITQSKLDNLCVSILNNKVDVESRLTSSLFDICLISGFYFSSNLDKREQSSFCFDIIKKLSIAFSEINLKFFVDAFSEGYKTDDCENYVRKCFYNLLEFELETGLPFIESAKEKICEDTYLNINDLISSEKYSDDFIRLRRKMQSITSNEFLHRIAVKYWKKNNDPELKKYIGNIRTIIDKKISYPALQDCLCDTLEAILTNGAALWKNDLLDAIILCNVQDQHIMITYDNGVINSMDKRKNDYPKYLESINTINELMK